MEGPIRADDRQIGFSQVHQEGGVPREGKDLVGLSVLLRASSNATKGICGTGVHIHPEEDLAQGIRRQESPARELPDPAQEAESLRVGGVQLQGGNHAGTAGAASAPAAVGA